MKLAWLWILPGLAILPGCLPMDPQTKFQLVSGNPFGTPPPPAPGIAKVNLTPAKSEVAAKVDFVGRKLLADNPQTGLKPVFSTIGSSTLEVFHVDGRSVYVTEGVVQKCKSEEELAAILAVELGKMVAEREGQASADVRNPEKLPPISAPIGNAGQFNGSDLTSLAELGKYEKENPKRPRNLSRPNPQYLALNYLEKAGYPRTSLQTVLPLLEETDRNCALERQLKGLPPQNSWNP